MRRLQPAGNFAGVLREEAMTNYRAGVSRRWPHDCAAILLFAPVGESPDSRCFYTLVFALQAT